MAAEDEWKFSQCFGEKADAEDLTDGACEPRHAPAHPFLPPRAPGP